MLVRQPVETVAYPVEFLNFAQNCSRRHCLSDVPESLEREKFRRADLVMYLEVVQKNYGKTGEYSSEVLDQLSKLRVARRTRSPQLAS